MGFPANGAGRRDTVSVSASLKVLVIDDHRLTAHALSDSLSSRGFDVVGVVHGVAEASEVMSELAPDVMLADLDMGPGPSGLDLAVRMRISRPRMGAVILTGYEDPKLFGQSLPEVPRHVVYLVKQRISNLSDVEEAVLLAYDYATGVKRPDVGAVKFPLSASQASLLRLLAQGLTNSAIAEQLSLTEDSVAKSVNRLARRLGVESSTGTNVRVGLTQRYFDMVGYQREV